MDARTRWTELARALPDDAVIVDPDVCAGYASDASEAAPVQPEAVIRARSTADVAATMRIAHSHGVSVTPRAGGTGRSGGAVPVDGGWVLAFEKFDGIDEIDNDDAVAVVEPGVVLGALHRAVEAQGLFYPPDPNSLAECRLGGNIAENAAGPRAFRYGATRDYVLGLEVVLADGTTLELGRRTKKGVTGYDLTSLVVGSEGTLAVVTKATLHLLPRPASIRTLIAFLSSEDAIAGAVNACLRQRVVPRCVELLGAITLDVLREQGAAAVPNGAEAMLLIELDGEDPQLGDDLERVGGALVSAGAMEVAVAKHSGDRERLWAVRREMSRALRRRATHKLSEDVVVPRSQLGRLLRRCRAISERHRVVMPTYGHAGDGNLHVNFLWDHADERPRVDAAIEALFRAVIEMRGTLSGEHGIGVLKAPYLPLEQSPALIALQQKLKAQFDPRGILNPGKIFPRRGHGPC